MAKPVTALPLVLLCACASTAQLPGADHPELAQMAQPYVQQLQAAGITRVFSPGDGAMAQLETAYGSVYVRYPSAAEPLAFVPGQPSSSVLGITARVTLTRMDAPDVRPHPFCAHGKPITVEGPATSPHSS